jgi:hypothetical protein
VAEDHPSGPARSGSVMALVEPEVSITSMQKVPGGTRRSHDPVVPRWADFLAVHQGTTRLPTPETALRPTPGPARRPDHCAIPRARARVP